eukprot:Tbor_TRINITY_DN5335_c0_g1::TRINITY_DN5335_c0_g1_i1::g.5205::m.5205/K15272/SLC35A1_2_3; solute carrier family 35 (UDP-sugar transporter), member A1/2/3
MVQPPSSRIKQKFFALVALTSVSTAVGLFSKLSQVGGKYEFHPCSAVVCTELFKMCISIVILTMSCITSFPLSNSACGVDKNKDGEKVSDGEDEVASPRTLLAGWYRPVYAHVRSVANGFYRAFSENVSKMLVVHLFGLAVMYTLINVMSFAIFVHASSSMFYLLKASSPVVTAVLLYIMVGRKITKAQWVAVVLQVVGLFATQLNSCPESVAQDHMPSESPLRAITAVTITGYILILINVIAGCVSGVWNEHVIKTFGSSVNVQNIILYFFGTAINMMLFLFAPLHWMGTTASPNQPGVEAQAPTSLGFFTGYNWSVVAIIIANGSVGLVITAVYKYADVIVKTSGIAGATVSLYGLEMLGVIPGKHTPLGPTVTGGAVVFYASYAYILPASAFLITCRGSNKGPSHVITVEDGIDANYTKSNVDDNNDGDNSKDVVSPVGPVGSLTWGEVWRSYHIRVLLTLVCMSAVTFVYSRLSCGKYMISHF